ncbi:hypothetical protein [Phormidesmis priestleyi]
MSVLSPSENLRLDRIFQAIQPSLSTILNGGVMTEHPDFLNVRRLAFLLVAPPIALLLTFSAIEASWHQVRVWQSAGVWCTQTTPDIQVKLYGNECKPQQ